MQGLEGARALPRGNAVFERLSNLLVDKFEREAFLEVSHDPGLDLAEHDHGFQRRAVFRGDGGARQRHVDDPAGHLGAVLEREQRNRVARNDTVVAAVFRQIEDVAVGDSASPPGDILMIWQGNSRRSGSI